MQSDNQKKISLARRSATRQLREMYKAEWLQLLDAEYIKQGVSRRIKKEKVE